MAKFAMTDVITFGKHKGKGYTVQDLLEKDPGWLAWLRTARLQSGEKGEDFAYQNVNKALNDKIREAGLRFPIVDDGPTTPSIESTEPMLQRLSKTLKTLGVGMGEATSTMSGTAKALEEIGVLLGEEPKPAVYDSWGEF